MRRWRPGDAVTVHCNYVDDQDPSSHDDSMLAANQRIWGFESNYGGLAEIALVRANQLMPKPAHLTWEEAAVNALCNSTSYRMIVSPHGAQMTQGQTVLVWGATGGIGAYACQYVLNGGGTPVGVVSSADKVGLLHELGVEHVIDRRAEGYRFWSDEHTQDPAEWRRLGKKIRELAGTDPDIVFEHPGRQTMGASVFVVQAGRDDHHVRRDERLHDRVRQPLSLDDAEDDQGLATSRTTARRGPRTSSSARARSTRRCHGCSRSRRPATRRTRCTTTATRASSASSRSRPRRASG